MLNMGQVQAANCLVLWLQDFSKSSSKMSSIGLIGAQDMVLERIWRPFHDKDTILLE